VAARVKPATAMVRGEVRASSLLARWVPAVMASARGRNATAASSGEKPSTTWKKMEVRKTVPAKMAVTPSMTVVPATSVTTFQVCGATRGRRARRSMIANAASSTADRLNAVRVRADSQPCALVEARPNIRL
jgi:hypothetical protein